MKTLKFNILTAILLSISSLTNGQNIKITIFNKTGYALDSLSFHHFQLGKISKDSTIFFDDIDEIILQGDIPLHRPFAIIKGKKRPKILSECATKSTKRKSGNYAFDVCIYEEEDTYRLYWKKHE